VTLGPRRERRQTESRFIHRVYTVFNARQIDRIPAQEPRAHSTFAPLKPASRSFETRARRYTHDQGRPRLLFALNRLHPPSARELFHDAPGYYGTALHELAHWTGHPDRLNRQTLNESYDRRSELRRAKNCAPNWRACFLAAERGIPHDPGSTPSYVSPGSRRSATTRTKFPGRLRRVAGQRVSSGAGTRQVLRSVSGRFARDLGGGAGAGSRSNPVGSRSPARFNGSNPEPVMQESGQAVGRFRRRRHAENPRQSGRSRLPRGA